MRCNFPDCDQPAEIYVIRRREAGPYGGVIKMVQYKIGGIVDVDDPNTTVGEKRCLFHGMPKLYWRRHLQSSLDFLKGI